MDEWDLRAAAAEIRPELPALIGAKAARELDALLAAALDLTPGRAKAELRTLLLRNAHKPVRDWAAARLASATTNFPGDGHFRITINGPVNHTTYTCSNDTLMVPIPVPERDPVPTSDEARWDAVDEQALSFQIAELGANARAPLEAGRDYTAVFKAGPRRPGNIFGGRDATLGALPSGGLNTRCFMTSSTARLSAADPADPEVTVAAVEAGRDRQWMVSFPLHIPEFGYSEERRLTLTPLDTAEARVEVQVLVGDDVYRQVTASLTIRRQAPGELPAPETVPVAGRSVEVIERSLLPAAHSGLVPANEWQVPARGLLINVTAGEATINGVGDAGGRWDYVAWNPVPAQVESAITGVRDALDRLRDKFPDYWDGIAPGPLLPALSQYTPPRDWLPAAQHPPNPKWSEVAASDELYDLAFYGHNLYKETFGDRLRQHIQEVLQPGDMLRLAWPEGGSSWIPELPLALMYLDPPRRGAVDPGLFLGLRYRLAYHRNPPPWSSRALGSWDRTTRAHLLYWGSGPADPLTAEADRHRGELATWAAGLRLLPDQAALADGTATAKALARYLESPAPAPVSLLYLYCHCVDGAGNSPVLRFGPATGPANELRLPDLGGTALPDAPVVFLNACASGAAGPLLANQLMRQFFRRGCRAYIGTEVKVPAALAARFATVFFSFLYGDAGRGIAPVGEAMAQARRFLWTEHQNIGGLFYSYVNDYYLYAAAPETVARLRGTAP